MSGLRVVHEIRGRLRIRVPPGIDLPHLAGAVRTEPGVVSSTWSARTRGLLVVYEPESQSAAALKDAVARHSGLDVPYELPPPPRSAGASWTVSGSATVAVSDGVGELDRRVQRATQGLMGLAGLLSLALSTWAASQIVRGRAGPLSWSAALWYAHGLFRDYSALPRE